MYLSSKVSDYKSYPILIILLKIGNEVKILIIPHKSGNMVHLTISQKEFMRKKYFATFAIASPKTARIYNTTVWLHYDETLEKFFVITNKQTSKWKFLKNGSREVGINVTDPKGWPYLTISGKVKIYFQNDREDFWEIIMDIIKKYNSGGAIEQWRKKMEDAGDRMLLELEPEVINSTV